MLVSFLTSTCRVKAQHALSLLLLLLLLVLLLILQVLEVLGRHGSLGLVALERSVGLVRLQEPCQIIGRTSASSLALR